MAQEIPVGAIVELRNSKEDWRVVSYWDNEVPKFCRQYMIQSLHTVQTKRAFKHEIFEKIPTVTRTYMTFFENKCHKKYRKIS